LGAVTDRVGIERLNVFPTTTALHMEDLGAARNFDTNFVRRELAVDERGVNPPWEDPVTMAVNAAAPILEGIDPDEIGLLIVGSESGVDQEKPISSWVHRYLGLGPQCRNFEVKHACYGLTGSIQLALSWLASGLAGDHKALLINTDQSVIALAESYEPVTGAGAAAILLSQTPRLVAYELGRAGVCAFEVSDVFRPSPKVETGNSETSLFSYLEGLEKAYAVYVAAVYEPVEFDAYFEWHVYHMPFPGMALRAHRTLLTASGDYSKDEARAHYERKCLPSTTFARRTGGVYGASTFVGLLGLVHGMDQVIPGDRIGVYAYGSGSCAEFYSVILLDEAKTVAAEADLGASLDSRLRLDIDTYEKIERERDESIMARDYTPRLYSCGDWFAERYEGRRMLVLDRIENYYRHYRWS
jgi:3-hydroxy-3-methylglutaryl CoA synthase